MANEITVQYTLTVRKGNLSEQRNDNFNADMDAASPGGPSPGQITALTTGTDIDISEVGGGGLCRIKNLDPTNYVTIGIKEPATGFFYPIWEIKPGEAYPVRLSRHILQEYTGTGTGTGPATNTLHAKADTAACKIIVEAFPK